MDGLALCCNLFADGPLTLRRLRAAGMRSLGELERVPHETLAEWLCASAPQARAFAAEARRLGRRIADELAPEAVERSAPTAERLRAIDPAPLRAPAEAVAPAAAAAPGALRPGLVPGLDACACERLAAAGVRTLQALAEGAGLALARRTGIPYSTLLFLARGARRVAGESPGARVRPSAPPLSARDLVRPEGARSDEFTLPLDETGPAGPFRQV